MDLLKSFAEQHNFEAIYNVIKHDLKDGVDKKDVYSDLFKIITGTYMDDTWVHDHEHGPTVKERTNICKGLAYDIEKLIERFAYIEKRYPRYRCDETGEEDWPLPNWLSQFTDEFDPEKLKKMSTQLREFEKQGNKLMENNAKPRLSSRKYYVEKLMKLYESRTNKKARIDKHHNHTFNKFIVAFFQYTKNTNRKGSIGLDALYSDYLSIINHSEK